MSKNVFVVSEWLPKPGKEQALREQFKKLLDLARKEPGCIRAHVTKQIEHPGSPTKSKYSIVLLQEYSNINAFDVHCAKNYVSNFFKENVDNESTRLVEEWRCRLFTEPE